MTTLPPVVVQSFFDELEKISKRVSRIGSVDPRKLVARARLRGRKPRKVHGETSQTRSMEEYVLEPRSRLGGREPRGQATPGFRSASERQRDIHSR